MNFVCAIPRMRCGNGLAVIIGAFVAACLLPSLALAQTVPDSDLDGLTDVEELQRYHTHPYRADTDGDGSSDGAEIANNTSPRHAGKTRLLELDSDNDGVNDAWEIKLQTNLAHADSDFDGFPDGVEIRNGYDPLSPLPHKREKTIRVDLARQRLVYKFGQTVLGEFPISSGLPKTPTPKGDFTVLRKLPVVRYRGPGYDFPNTKWNLLFTIGRQGYYIHGAYWHNDFGRPKSHGCVNVAYRDMERLYAFANVDTKVIIQ